MSTDHTFSSNTFVLTNVRTLHSKGLNGAITSAASSLLLRGSLVATVAVVAVLPSPTMQTVFSPIQSPTSVVFASNQKPQVPSPFWLSAEIYEWLNARLFVSQEVNSLANKIERVINERFEGAVISTHIYRDFEDNWEQLILTIDCSVGQCIGCTTVNEDLLLRDVALAVGPSFFSKYMLVEVLS
jgi:hypothetical protein